MLSGLYLYLYFNHYIADLEHIYVYYKLVYSTGMHYVHLKQI